MYSQKMEDILYMIDFCDRVELNISSVHSYVRLGRESAKDFVRNLSPYHFENMGYLLDVLSNTVVLTI